MEKERRVASSRNISSKDTDTLVKDLQQRIIQQAMEITRPHANIRQIRLKFKTLLDEFKDIEVYQTVSGDTIGEEEEYDSNILNTTKLFRELLGQSLLQNSVESLSDSGLPDSISTMSSQYLDDGTSFVEEDFTSQTRDYTANTELLAVDDTEKSTGEKGMLNSTELNALCSSEGRLSTCVTNECDRICAFIKAESDQIIHVCPTYKIYDKTAIVFLVFAKREIKVRLLPWTFEVRIVHQYSEESKGAMFCEKNTPLSMETSRKIGNIVDKNASELMQNHTFLSAISASSVLSKHYGTSSHKIEPTSCIVLSVLVKHFIPLNEEPFPTILDGIPVDVREGGAQFCGYSAEDFHDQVQMGCKITSTLFPQKHGTLGGFVEHPEYGLCGFTCAHVVLDDKLKLELKEKANVKEHAFERPCAMFQPCYDPKEENKFGRLVEVTYKEGGNGKSGVDLALFKIELRPPKDGNFPDDQGKTTTIKYESGHVWGKAGIPSNLTLVQKFGFVTGLTYGNIQFDSAVIREFPFHSEVKENTVKFTTTLYKQYHIKSNDETLQFSKLGDSGALVLMKDNTGREDDLRCIGMVVGVLNDNTCAVTPITAILEEWKVAQLKPFLPSWEQINNQIDWKVDMRLREIMKECKETGTTNRSTNTFANAVANHSSDSY